MFKLVFGLLITWASCNSTKDSELNLDSNKLNIAIHCSPYTRSHISAVLEISQILISRGHSVTFAAFDIALTYAKGYNVSLHSLGVLPKGLKRSKPICKEKKHQKSLDQITETWIKFAPIVATLYKETFYPLSEFFDENKIDIVICDHASYACSDIARVRGIPLVVGFQALGTGILEGASYITANSRPGPLTTMDMSAFQRARVLFEKHIKNPKSFGPLRDALDKVRSIFSMPRFRLVNEKHEYGLAISSSFLGFEPAQPIHPAMRMMGPITLSQAQNFDQEMAIFLDSHDKVLYIALGSFFCIDIEEINVVFQAALDALSSGVIDGLVWGLGNTDLADFPQKVMLNGIQVETESLLANNPNLRILKWAPQTQILKHRSTKLFLTHGGMNSCLEAISSETPILGLPFSLDQPKNIAKMVHAGIGLSIRRPRMTSTSLATKIRTIIEDKDNHFKLNLKRMKIISHYGERRLRLAADMVEEHAFLAQTCRPHQPYDSKGSVPPCELAHLVPAGEQMSFIKTNNVDLYVVAAFSCIAILVSAFTLIIKLLNSIRDASGFKQQSKLKLD